MHYLSPSCRRKHYNHSTEVEEVKWPSKRHIARRLILQPLHFIHSLCCPWKPACPRASLLIHTSLMGYPGCPVLQAFRFEKFLPTLWINPFVSCLQVFAHTVPSSSLRVYLRSFPGGSVVKNLPASAGDTGLITDREDLTYCGAAKPMCGPQLLSLCSSLGTTTSEACVL